MNTALLAHFYQQHVCPLALHKFAFGGAATPLVLAEPLVPLVLLPELCICRPVLMTSERAPPAARSAGGNQVKENASMDRVSGLCRGCFCCCLRLQPSCSPSERELESWYHWASHLLHSLFYWVQQLMKTVSHVVLAVIEEMHFFSPYKRNTS